MKKFVCLTLILFLFTGCTITKIEEESFDSIINTVLYKDSNLTKDLGIEVNADLTEEDLKQYILDEKEQLEQYTYTFDIATDGFYYYTGVKRTQE